MRAQTVEVDHSAGRILCCTIFRPGGKKLLPKGHVISDDDVALLSTEGMEKVWVTSLEAGEVSEEEAVLRVAEQIACGSIEIRPAPGGRANLMVTEDCCALVDDDLLRQINCTASIVIATARNFQFLRAGERAATVKSTPFAVPQEQLEAVISILAERGPLLQARPLQSPSVAVLYSDPQSGERARQFFEGVVKQRLEAFGIVPRFSLAVAEDEERVSKGLEHLLKARPSAVLIASTTAPAGPEDAVGRAMARAGCHLEKFLAPVEPGVLTLLGYSDNTPVISSPGCFRSAKSNVLDLILPPLLARYRVSGWEIAGLGHGGLLS
jgi:molybdenum cofactor cytidylyltransferase